MTRRYRGRHAPHVPRHSARRRRPGALPVVVAGAVTVLAVGGGQADAHEHPHEVTLSTTQRTLAAAVQRAAEADATQQAQRRASLATDRSAALARAEATQRAARATQRRVATERRERAEAERRAKRWVAPLSTWRITSGFGPRWGRTHDGLDVGASTGTPLRAMSSGVVVAVGWRGSFGKKVEIRYWNGDVGWYAHLSRIDVAPGQAVTPGEVVGAVGSTGRSTGPHLHLEIQPAPGVDSPRPPVPWLRERGILR